MKVYIEQVLFTNFIINFCILIVVVKFILYKTNYIHITLSATFGSFASLITPFCTNILLLNIIKILIAVIMLQILHINKKQFVKAGLLMLSLTYIIGGAILSNLGSKTQGGYIVNITNLIPIFIITIIFAFICCKLISYVKSQICSNTHIFSTTLILNSNRLNIKSFVDSGNALCDNNKPVSLINFDTFTRLTNLTLDQYLTKQFDTLLNPHFITASTIAGKQKILVFTINELHLNSKIYKDVQIGVSLHFDNTKEYKAILNSSFCLN